MSDILAQLSENLSDWKKNSGENYFMGEYVVDFCRVATASLLSGVHASFQSPPGWGKTDVLDRFASEVAGKDGYHMIQLQPSSNPAVFDGLNDPKEIIENGKFIKVVDNTPYDPKMRVIIADELFRANDPTFDSALHALDPKKQDHCIVWATNNFVAKGKRVEALLDRIALWLWTEGATIDVKSLVCTMMGSLGKPKLPHYVPTWDEIEEIRMQYPTENAVEAVSKIIKLLVEEASELGFNVGHPRQISQWWRILFYCSCAYAGTNDFKEVPQEVLGILKYAFPSKSYDEQIKWSSIMDVMKDPVEAEIDRVLAENVAFFKEVASQDSFEKRTSMAPELGKRLSDAQSTLKTQFDGSNDPRIGEAIKMLSNWLAQAIAGNPDELDY